VFTVSSAGRVECHPDRRTSWRTSPLILEDKSLPFEGLFAGLGEPKAADRFDCRVFNADTRHGCHATTVPAHVRLFSQKRTPGASKQHISQLESSLKTPHGIPRIKHPETFGQIETNDWRLFVVGRDDFRTPNARKVGNSLVLGLHYRHAHRHRAPLSSTTVNNDRV
jgi:hypothetical protein